MTFVIWRYINKLSWTEIVGFEVFMGFVDNNKDIKNYWTLKVMTKTESYHIQKFQSVFCILNITILYNKVKFGHYLLKGLPFIPHTALSILM